MVWEFRNKTIFEMCDLMGVVDGTEVAPEAQDKDGLKVWKQKNKVACNTITLNLKDNPIKSMSRLQGRDPRQASLVSRCRSHRIGKRLKGESIWRTNTQIHGSYILVHGISRNNGCGSSNVGHCEQSYCYGMPRRRVLCIW